jgi:toxin ParE1/3/4
MVKVIIWSEPAREDLQHIYDFIANDSSRYAKKVVDEIIEKSEQLKNFPNIGRVVPEIDDDSVREVFIYSYRMMYQVSDESIKILALVHFKQNFQP